MMGLGNSLAMNPWASGGSCGGSCGADNNTEVVGNVHFRRTLTLTE